MTIGEAAAELPFEGFGASRERPRLVIVPVGYPAVVSGTYRLAYEVTLEIPSHRDRRRVYVSAENGSVLGSRTLMAHATVPGGGETTYYGARSFPVDSVAPMRFELRDEGRGGSAVYADDYYEGEVFGHSAADFGSAVQSEAIDVYYGTLEFYDLMAELDWVGIDGEGLPYESVVFRPGGGGDFVNAFWNGTNAAFGNGTCHYGPLTTIDVVGHEYAHGVTQYTSDLIYNDESGALNEAMSDIFGKALELKVEPEQFSWVLGNGFADSEYARAFRSMEDPTLYYNPKVYRGEYWEDGAGVHTNSGVLGHWFYLLVEGETGVNEFGDPYDVESLGVDEALAHAWGVQRDYLTESSGYVEAYLASLDLAALEYGEGSDVYASIEQAWRACGLTPAVAEDYDSSSGSDIELLLYSAAYVACGDDEFITLHADVDIIGDTIILEGSTLEFEIEDLLTGEIVGVYTGVAQTDLVGFAYDDVIITTDIAVDTTADSYQWLVRLLEGEEGSDEAYAYFSTESSPYEVYAFGPYFEEAEPCQRTDAVADIYLLNRGCADLPATEVNLKYLRRGREIGSQVVALDGPVESGEFAELFGLDLDFELVIRADAIYFDVGIASLDSFPLTAPLNFDYAPFIAPVGQLALDTLAQLEDSLGNTSAFYADLGLVEWGEHTYWGTTGSFWTDDPPCPDVVDNFNDEYQRGKISACVDYSAFEQPTQFSFSAVQLQSRRDNAYGELSDRFNAIGIELYLDGRYDVQTSLRGIDRSETTYSREIPAGYVGPISVYTYNQFGRGADRFDGTYEADADYTLIRDLRFGDQTSSTQAARESPLAVYPNPAVDRVTVAFPAEGEARLRVRSAIGTIVHDAAVNSGRAELGVRDWPAGLYHVELEVTRTGERYGATLVR